MQCLPRGKTISHTAMNSFEYCLTPQIITREATAFKEPRLPSDALGVPFPSLVPALARHALPAPTRVHFHRAARRVPLAFINRYLARAPALVAPPENIQRRPGRPNAIRALQVSMPVPARRHAPPVLEEGISQQVQRLRAFHAHPGNTQRLHLRPARPVSLGLSRCIPWTTTSLPSLNPPSPNGLGNRFLTHL